MGGFGFGMLAGVEMLGFYQARHPQTQRPFLAYVLQVTPRGAGPPFLIYRRYSQIAALASKLHFHVAVGLPPKYALQVFPLTDEQLRQRFEGLRAFLREVLDELTRQHELGLQHDVASPAGLDMQIFYDFVAHQRNRPPPPVKSLPEWATPTTLRPGAASMPLVVPASASTSTLLDAIDIDDAGDGPRPWQDIDSVDSEDVGLLHLDEDAVSGGGGTGAGAGDTGTYREPISNQFRNELLQAEGNLNALANCLRAYERATRAWWSALGAVVDEYQRVGDMPLFRVARKADGSTERRRDDTLALPPSRLVALQRRLVGDVEPPFGRRCRDEVLGPLLTLVGDVLPEVKHSYWTRLANLQQQQQQIETNGGGLVENAAVRRLLQERETLHEKIRTDTQESVNALVRLQQQILEDMGGLFAGLTAAECSSDGPAVMDARNVCDAHESPRPTTDDDDNGLHPSDSPTAVEAKPAPTTPEPDPAHVDAAAGDSIQDTTRKEEVVSVADDWSETSGRVWVWGRPPKSEVGAPLVLRPKQVPVLPGQTIVQIACGGEHLLYLTDGGDVYTFGDTDERRSSSSSTKAPVAASSFLAPRLIEEFALEKALHRTKIVRVACGAQHSLGLTETGELYTWGSGEDGRLGHGDMRDRSIPRKVMSLLRHRVVQASCGGAHTAVLTDRHAVFVFGRGKNGRLGLGDNKWRDTPQEVTGFPQGTALAQVVCGWNFTVARALDGRVYAWGKQGEGQCGLGYVDKDQLVPRVVEKLAEAIVVDVACGYTHTLALTSTGDVYSWGLGEYGQLGRGIVYQPVPEQVDFADVLCAPDVLERVHCGAFHSIVTTEAKVMYAWGLNLYGACGLGHTVNKDTPERIDCFQPTKELVVACGHKYTVAVEVQHQQHQQHQQHCVAMASASTGGGSSFDGTSMPLRVNTIEYGAIPSADWTITPTSSSQNGIVPSTPPGTGPLGDHATETRDTIHEKEEELRRAKKLWRTRILRDWEESKDTPLAHALWRQGIPPSVRSRVWPLAIGNKLKITPEMYQIYRERAIAYKQERQATGPRARVLGKEHTLALIDTDLPRTFPSLRLFDATGPYYAFLLEVLETYACYRPDLGYIQGMSYLAALLCLHMPQDRFLAFQCLANLMVNEHLFTFYLLDAELSDVYYRLFDEFLGARLPDLHRHLRGLGVTSAMYLMNWLQTLFLQVLPLELAARVIDNFLLDGTVFLFRVAMAIHELLRKDLDGADLDEAMPILQRSHLYQDLWLARITEDELFGAIANIAVPTHIYAALDRVVNDVFFYEKRRSKGATTSGGGGGGEGPDRSSGGQSVGIGRVKNERRRMYSIGDTLNGVLGGF